MKQSKSVSKHQLTQRPMRVLIVDGDEGLRESLSADLIREGYTVEQASSGEEALRLIKANLPDLVILELMLPNMDGYQLCRQIRSSHETQHLNILMITASGDDVETIVSLEFGADDFVAKPFSVPVLSARVRALFRRRRAPRPKSGAPLTVGDIFIDPARYQVFVAGEEIRLSITEFRILSLLAFSTGRVFSRSKIVTELHGADAVITERTVDVHIASLRKKLGESSNYLETVRGVGYRLRDSKQ